MTGKTEPNLYFVNGVVDGLFIGGASIGSFAVLKALEGRVLHQTVADLVITLAWVCNWPHFAATSYRLYRSRGSVGQYPMTAFVLPFVVVAGIAAAALSPALFAPYWILVFQIWSPYHFSGQTVGITLIYARRAGVTVDRLTLSTFVFGMFLAAVATSQVQRDSLYFYGIAYPRLGIPTWVPGVLRAMTVGSGFAFLLLLAASSVRSRRIPPAIVILPAGAQYVWFALGARLATFQELVPFFHCLQYLLIAWAMNLKEQMDERRIRPSWRYLFSESARWGVLIFLGGAALFFVAPLALGRAAGLSAAFATGVVIAGVQIHHFFVDGVIWKLKRTTVSSPLTMNVGDVVRPAA